MIRNNLGKMTNLLDNNDSDYNYINDYNNIFINDDVHKNNNFNAL